MSEPRRYGVRAMVADVRDSAAHVRTKVEGWGSRILAVLGLLMIMYFVGALVVFFYQAVDHVGYISHTEVTEITVSSNWLDGEIKQCDSAVLLSGAASAGKPYGYAISAFVCDDSPLKTFTVKFFGRTVQPEYVEVQWNCRRELDTFTCKQTGGTRYRGWKP